jgi:hypothetical protein
MEFLVLQINQQNWWEPRGIKDFDQKETLTPYNTSSVCLVSCHVYQAFFSGKSQLLAKTTGERRKNSRADERAVRELVVGSLCELVWREEGACIVHRIEE